MIAEQVQPNAALHRTLPVTLFCGVEGLCSQVSPVSAPRWAEALLLPIVVFISISLLIAFACHHWRKYVDPRCRANN